MFCGMAKEYLSQRRVSFEDKDITKDPGALEELRKLGYMTTPVLVIGETVIVGFDQAKIDAALERLLHNRVHPCLLPTNVVGAANPDTGPIPSICVEDDMSPAADSLTSKFSSLRL